MSVNKLLPTLHINRFGVYYLKFRISNKLRRFFTQEFISKSLFTKEYKKAQVKAMVYRSRYIEILQVSEWLDDKTLQLKVNEYLRDTLKLVTVELEETQAEPKGLNLENAIALYDKWYKKQGVAEKQYIMVKQRLGIALKYFGKNRLIRELTTDDIEKYIHFLSTFPNNNKKPYKGMSLAQIKKLKNIPQQDYLSPSTVIKYIKVFQQLENFLVDDGKIDRKISKRAKLPTPPKVSRSPFTDDDLKILYREFDKLGKMGLIYYTYAYSGMRTGEFWKSKIAYSKGVYYFDLSYEDVDLKTNSSKRKIPIHSKLLHMDIVKHFTPLQQAYKQAFISDTFNKKIIYCIEDNKNKVLYGFRHTVATKLKQADVDIDKISELLGHRYENTSMTKMVYTNGYSLEQLKEAIECL